MATIDAAERARLIKLGNLAMNESERAAAILLKQKNLPITKSTIAAVDILTPAAQKLLVLSELLGVDGQIFGQEGERVLRDGLQFMSGLIAIFRASLELLVKMYESRDEQTAAKITAASESIRLGGMLSKESLTSIREIDTWIVEEFLALPLAEGEKKTNCTFCGARSTEYRKLLTCGRCKGALYCDKVCQTLHFKKGHKAECTAKAKEGKEADVNAVATNRWERDRTTMPVDGVIPDRIAANTIITNVHKLMVVGKLIGGDDGKEFIRRGERIIHQYLRVLPHSLSAMRESADISITKSCQRYHSRPKRGGPSATARSAARGLLRTEYF
ncbi:uncharacterized protein MYCGRDRAFT_94999 [Zymoseptoria tritici IPO323]|uniref:MYND-type domain-containing protein n=1 Tax=Zymoseptoria tritici (strain CBS 115943 / IPO323) TaxID=336722 RepID=F9XGV0_ZYMTI|nr:uncharacterized protein MYCGRDRAFT_94999 [Zymoseptoria tritici IPO323]EGP84919.1 hypothetical protein MYCGRDRAFT_94999 [Zymoseptoria tritici IPO323]